MEYAFRHSMRGRVRLSIPALAANRRLGEDIAVLAVVSLLLFAGVWTLGEVGIRRQVGRLTAMATKLGLGDQQPERLLRRPAVADAQRYRSGGGGMRKKTAKNAGYRSTAHYVSPADCLHSGWCPPQSFTPSFTAYVLVLASFSWRIAAWVAAPRATYLRIIFSTPSSLQPRISPIVRIFRPAR